MNFEGAQVSVIRSNRKTVAIQLKPGQVIIRAPLKLKDSEIERIAEGRRAWIEKNLVQLAQKQSEAGEVVPFTRQEINDLAEKAMQIIPQRVEYYAKAIGVTYEKVTIRCQRKRWGSCSSKGNLSFNCILMLFPDEVIDSVVVHELCHRKQMNHSAKFYAEVERVFPDYRRWDRWLNENGAKQLKRVCTQDGD